MADPIRIVVQGAALGLSINGAFGTVTGCSDLDMGLPIRPGVLYNIAWLEENPIDMQFGSGAANALDIESDEIDGKYLTVIPEKTFLAEATDIALDNG